MLINILIAYYIALAVILIGRRQGKRIKPNSCAMVLKKLKIKTKKKAR